MEKTWRWFGKKDKITLPMLRQIGVEGIVTALHEIPNGEVWTLDAVLDLKKYIEDAGLRWSVVESLPVSEAIKYGGSDKGKLIDSYILSLSNLGKAGVKTVCYNFMPVIDWIRTDLQYPLADGSSSLYFNYARFAYFDLYLLKREGAAKEYPAEVRAKAAELDKTITEAEKEQLIDAIIVKTQGFVNGNIKAGDKNPVQRFKQLLALYQGIDRNKLRENMRSFLAAIMPVCEQYGINMCVHPDDPPFQVLGLPRIVGSEEDIAWILNAVDNPHNGLTFCAGSLSAGEHNDTRELARKFAKRTHFIHLRSTGAMSGGNFIESSHLEGRGHLIDLIRIFEKEKPGLPMRIDHGRLMLGDEDKGYNPGYSFHGRMLALAQVEGMMAAVKKELNQPFGIAGKVAVITGAGGVLGGSIAKSFIRQGAKVAALDIRQEQLDTCIAELAAEGGDAAGFVGNVLDIESMEKVAAQILEKWGRIDILLNIAGGNTPDGTLAPDKDFFDMPVAAWEKVTNLNLNGTVYPSMVFGKVMARQKSGSIINVSSMAAYSAITRVPGYSAAKTAVANFTQWLASEMALKYGEGVRVNAIAPGFFIGDQNRAVLINPDGSLTERSKKVLAKTPMKRFGDITELNGAVQFLCSDAAAFVTGVVLPIDGGFSAFSGV